MGAIRTVNLAVAIALALLGTAAADDLNHRPPFIVGEILGTGAPAAKPAPAPAPTAPASPATNAAAAAPLPLAPRGESAARVPAEVTSGYEALRSGDLESARRAYQAALARDPRWRTTFLPLEDGLALGVRVR